MVAKALATTAVELHGKKAALHKQMLKKNDEAAYLQHNTLKVKK